MADETGDFQAWDDVEEVLARSISDVMLTDEWRNPVNLHLVQHAIENDSPLPVRVKAKQLLALLDTPLDSMSPGQLVDLTDELVELFRFVCHRGRDE